ncbi:MAG: cell division protein FtsZ, partial [Propionibacterium sp.]|nr:cell division protein FtsZ [Propionibacterium sp.]
DQQPQQAGASQQSQASPTPAGRPTQPPTFDDDELDVPDFMK